MLSVAPRRWCRNGFFGSWQSVPLARETHLRRQECSQALTRVKLRPFCQDPRTFSCRTPRAERESNGAKVTAHPTFLVLDDDEDTRFLARHALERAFPGARVFESANADDAVSAAQSASFDGVITDHHLGTGDGASIIRRLRAAGVACPVVMVTASSDPSVFRHAYEAGAARVFAGSDFDFVSYFRKLLQSDQQSG